MIGQTIRPRRSVPWASGFFLAVALLLIVMGWQNDRINNGLLLAVFPFALAVALWLGRLRPRAVQVTETGLVVENGPTIDYDAIESIHTSQGPAAPSKPGRPSRTLQVLHRGGILFVPPNRDISSDEVCQFLFQQLPPSGSRDVGPQLADFLSAQENHFGKGQVRCYRARTHLGRGFHARTIGNIGLAGVVTAAVWMVVGASHPGSEMWLILGFPPAIAGIFAVIVGWFDRGESRSRVKNWRAARLVVGPAGLAMIQGETKGELTWHQVRDVRFCPPPGWITISNDRIRKGIHLQVEGAQIVIADVYDRPLYAIFQAIQSCWMRYQ